MALSGAACASPWRRVAEFLQGGERRVILAELIERLADLQIGERDIAFEPAVVRRGGRQLGHDRLRLPIVGERARHLALRRFDVADVGVGDADVALQRGVGGTGGDEFLRKGEPVPERLQRVGQIVARLLHLGDVVERERALAQDRGVARVGFDERVVDRQRGVVLRQRAVEIALVGENGADEIVGDGEIALSDRIGGRGGHERRERGVGLARERQRAGGIAEIAQGYRAFELRGRDAGGEVGRRPARADELLLERARAVEHVLDDRHRHAGGAAEALREVEDEIVGGLGGEAQRVLGVLSRRVRRVPLGARQRRQRQRRGQADPGAPGDALVGGGDRLGVGEAALLLLAFAVAPRRRGGARAGDEVACRLGRLVAEACDVALGALEQGRRNVEMARLVRRRPPPPIRARSAPARGGRG